MPLAHAAHSAEMQYAAKRAAAGHKGAPTTAPAPTHLSEALGFEKSATTIAEDKSKSERFRTV